MKKRLLFDIACFSGQTTMTGVLRYIVEVLSRLTQQNEWDITLVCSSPEEESAYLNLRQFLSADLPFQSYKGIDYLLHAVSKTKNRENGKGSFLKRIEKKIEERFPDNRFIKKLTDAARAVKWYFFPPLYFSERQRSPFFENLIRESDIYFSPFHALIPELDVNPAIKKVLVVHDLIPVLFADLYTGFSHFPQNPWESITPEVIVFADSESTKRDLIECYPSVSEKQVSVIYLAADERFKPCSDTEKNDGVKQKYKIPAECQYIFSVATLDVRKNFDTVIRSFARFITENGSGFPDVQLVLTGAKGWQDRIFYEQYSNLPEEIKLRIIFTGYVADADIPFLYAGAKCFCYMPLYEGFGLPPLEAMQSGCPVIVSNNSSLPEVVGDAAILLDAKDEIGLADSFKRILSDEKLRQELSQKGFRQAEKFSWERCIEQIIEKINSTNGC